MSVTGIHGQSLDVTVVGCNKLKDTEWFSRQDPYVCLEYGSTKFRTRTCTDGGKNPKFQEKLVFQLIEGLRELNVLVWNSNTLTVDDFIGSGKVQLQKVLSQGYDDTTWPIQTKNGRHAGEVRLILHYENARKQHTYAASAAPQTHMYHAPPLAHAAPYLPPASAHSPSAYPSYQPNSAAYSPYPYSPPQQSAYPPQPSAYPPPPQSAYPPPQPSAYPPQPYPAPSAYPQSSYPPPPQASPYPPGPYSGAYPPPSY